MTDSDRFWAKVAKQSETDCWLWTARIGVRGYGHFWVSGTNVLAHRFAYEDVVAPIPSGLQIDHQCGNRACVNPTHLDPVPCRINLQRSAVTQASINAAKTHCPHGHPYSGDNVHLRPSGGRRCRACARDYATAVRRSRGIQPKGQADEGATA